MTAQNESGSSISPQKQNASPHAYRPDIDGLRALAVIIVVVFHAFPEILRGGFVGVDVFFVISGFLIGGIILRDLAEEKFSFLHFYARRILRIFPALALVLTACLAAGYFLLFNDEYERLGKHVFGGAAFISNLMYYFEAGYWDINGKYKPLLHLWSLGIEEQFYIIIPIVLAAAWKRKYSLLTVTAVLLFASFACNIYYYRSHQELDFYMPFTRFWEIFMGVMLAALAERGNSPHHAGLKLANSRAGAVWAVLSKDDWRHARNALSILGLGCLIVGVLASRERHFPGHRALWPTFGAAFIIAAGSRTWLNRTIFSNRLAVGIGLISYPLYLWHWLLLSLAVILNGKFAGEQEWLRIRVSCVTLSILLAFLTYIFVERPLRFGKGVRKVKIGALVALMICIGGVGLYCSLTGAPERSFMKSYQITTMEQWASLAYPVRNDDSIVHYAPEAKDLRFARYHDAGGNRTVAVIGDSHSPPVFHGIAESDHGLNSVLLTYYPDDQPQQERELVLAVLKEKNDISDVFVVVRAMLHVAEEEAGWAGEQNYHHRVVDAFKPWLQELIDELRGVGKRVYILGENPVFPCQPQALIRRPFFNLLKNPPVMTREDVYRHQKEYLDILSGIHGAEIINGIDLFIRDNECSMLSEDGFFLYCDDDHLSTCGGRYLVKNLLEPYLSAIARRGGESIGEIRE